eukprot:1457240-Rhodomonas_salina.1
MGRQDCGIAGGTARRSGDESFRQESEAGERRAHCSASADEASVQTIVTAASFVGSSLAC